MVLYTFTLKVCYIISTKAGKKMLIITKNHRINPKGRAVRPPRKSGQWIRKEKRRAIYLLDGNCCRLCGKTEKELKKAKSCLTLDHLICWSDWGSNKVCNLITLCLECNSSRGTDKIEEFIVGKPAGFVSEIKARLTYNEKDLAAYKVAAKFWIANGEDLSSYPSI